MNRHKTPKLFIPFIVAGHPNYETSLAALLVLGEAYADMIEVGVPHSDPLADGPVIQNAHGLAIQQGMNLQRTLDLIEAARQQGLTTPIILFSYVNPILSMGIKDFAARFHAANIQALLVVDLPFQKDCDYTNALANENIPKVLLVSPTTPEDKIVLYDKANPYFIYYISRIGVTGIQKTLSESLAAEIQAIRTLVSNRICVGFGISTAEQAATGAQHADGVIVGSLLVDLLNQADLKSFQETANALAHAIHG